MSGARPGNLPPLADTQRDASDPRRHVWLSASAGTGKTQVLTARVFRLLLRGVDPGAILCLTFTKAGAAEMASRISDRLARWVRLPENDLKKDLFALGEDANDERLRARARTLFAKLLDAPGGGIRIQTIHSFCQTLLSAFPVEAELVPGFRPLEAREEAVMAREALAELLSDEAVRGERYFADAIGALSLRLGEGQAEAFLQACARAQDAMAALPSGIEPYLRRQLDLPSGDIDAEIENCCGDAAFDVAALRRIADANRAWGTATGTGHAEIVELWLAERGADRVEQLATLRSVFHTGKGEPRKYSAKLSAADPDYAELAGELGGRCAELLSMRARAEYAGLLAKGLEAGRAYAAAYALAKRRAGAVDFDDLIHRALALLEQPGMGDWVRYKLDQATEHVLIDEAQDTNWDQWSIVFAIADEFFAGEGAQHSVRTLFTVGDYKQAIFGFQGTDPLNFALAHRRYELKAGNPPLGTEARPLDTMSLTASYRSTRPVLEFVDAAIGALPEPGMGAYSDVEAHASEVAGPGRIELWPPVVEGGDSEADEEAWVDDATREVAKRIAKQVRQWLDDGLMLESKGRAIRPEDVMILVKRRGELASLLVARLYAEGVPVAGVDRLRLNAPLAVQDLLAAVRFVLQPEDDLSLASLLVSPLIGWTQDDLMVAAPRKHGSLWKHLQDTQASERLEPLRAMLRRADIATPYRFLEEILSGPLGGRRKLIRRLGEEARDPVAELLSAALDFERLATPSLQRFLDWFDRGEVEIVRDPSQPRDAVRVMTAHGAKGLQAPVVILADATVDPTNNRRDILMWKQGELGDVRLPIFRPRGEERGGPLDEVLTQADARELEEHWRLFYVAATRAEERLLITGALGRRSKGEVPAMSWHAVAGLALDGLGVEKVEEGPRIFEGRVPQRPVARQAETARDAAGATDLPDWLRRPAPVEARPPRPLAPSSLGEDAVADPPPSPAMRDAAERGRMLHALFERLPAVAQADRRAAALRWLEQAQGVADEKRREDIAEAALAVIDDPRFADLFGPESLAEAPIVAVVAGEVVSGTVDRLLVTDTVVRVIDFKTGRRAPAALDEVPDYHLRQMAAYAAALGVIFPDREVEAALLYTATPVLFTLPPELLARHKPGLQADEQSLAPGA